jgi:hypothetical protein
LCRYIVGLDRAETRIERARREASEAAEARRVAEERAADIVVGAVQVEPSRPIA